MWDRHFSDKGIMNHFLTLKIWISIRDDGKRTRASKFTCKPSRSAKRMWVSIPRDTVPQFQFQGISCIALDTVLFSFSYWSRLIRIRARPAQTWLNLTTKWFFSQFKSGYYPAWHALYLFNRYRRNIFRQSRLTNCQRCPLWTDKKQAIAFSQIDFCRLTCIFPRTSFIGL